MIELEKIFDIKYGNQLDLNKMAPTINGVNFIGRSGKNNGVTGIVKEINDVKPYPSGVITVALGGSVLSSFLQVCPFYTGQNVVVLIPADNVNLTEVQKLYYCQAIYLNAYRFSTCGREANRTLKKLLVPSINEIPNWVNGIDLSIFNNADKCKHQEPLVNPINSIDSWNIFTLEELFILKKGKRLTKANMIKGTTPFIGSTDSNNGLTTYVGQNSIHTGNVITVNYNGSVGEAFYQPKDFWASDDVNVLYPRKKYFRKFNQYIALFIIPILRLNKFKFSYGRKWHMDRMKKSKIALPVKNGKLDLDVMERFVKTLPYSINI
jgi:hypothetical protein